MAFEFFDYQIGRNIIWQGAPVCTLLTLEKTNPADEPIPEVTLNLVSSFGEQHRNYRVLLDASSENNSVLLLVDYHGYLDSKEIEAGCYDLIFEFGFDHTLNVSEPVVILSNLDYYNLVKSNADERFLPSKPLENATQLLELLTSIIQQHATKLTEAQFDTGIKYVGLLEDSANTWPIDSAPLRWIFEALADDLKYLLLFQPSDRIGLSFFLYGTNDALKLVINVDLEPPIIVYNAVIEAISDRNLGNIFVANIGNYWKRYNAAVDVRNSNIVCHIHINLEFDPIRIKESSFSEAVVETDFSYEPEETRKSSGVLVGRTAPDFEAAAVLGNGTIVERYSLSRETKDKYVAILFYPLDFTVLSLNKLIALDQRMDELKMRGVEVLAVSIDSQFAHNAWLNTPIEKGGIGPMRYTMIADVSHSITQAYDVEVLGSAIAYCGLFLIDKSGIVRHQVVNDLVLALNMDELIRMIDALQFFEEHGEIARASWNKAQDGIAATRERLERFQN